MARKKNRDNEESNGTSWLDTYADTITLLLTFFVLLYSMSSIDNQKLKALSDAFRLEMMGESSDSILDLENGSEPITENGLEDDLPNNVEQMGEAEEVEDNTYLEELEKLYSKVDNFIKENDMENEVTITKTDQGVALQLKDNVLFETASADLTNNSYPILDKIYTLITDIPNKLLVEGHTDNRPMNTDRYPSNWELSTARAVNVLKYFVEVKGISPERLSAAGYGEYKPLAENDSWDNMAKNRRVSILILNMDTY